MFIQTALKNVGISFIDILSLDSPFFGCSSPEPSGAPTSFQRRLAFESGLGPGAVPNLGAPRPAASLPGSPRPRPAPTLPASAVFAFEERGNVKFFKFGMARSPLHFSSEFPIFPTVFRGENVFSRDAMENQIAYWYLLIFVSKNIYLSDKRPNFVA